MPKTNLTDHNCTGQFIYLNGSIVTQRESIMVYLNGLLSPTIYFQARNLAEGAAY